MTMEHDDFAMNLTLELRRGVLVLAVLSQLKTPQYGYDLMKLLNEKGLQIDQGTLYPLLRRLEKQSLLDSEWRMEEARPRRYYVISADGQKAQNQLVEEWKKINQTLENLLDE